MTETIRKSINSAVMKLLTPLVRILLRNGVPYGAFCEFTKKVYVDVASRDFEIDGKKQTSSRVAVLTGLSRKEVKRVSELPEEGDLDVSDRYNRAVRVINGWRKDFIYLDRNGRPKELYFEKGEHNFSTIVKAYSGDIPPRAMLDEMIRTGVVEMKDGKIRLLTDGYIVKQGEAEKISIMGTDTNELISTIDHNITRDPEDAFFQRKVSYDNIPKDALQEVRDKIAKLGADFIDSVNTVISMYDRDINPSVKGDGKKKAGLGIFYFE
jgi:hypothetical protein